MGGITLKYKNIKRYGKIFRVKTIVKNVKNHKNKILKIKITEK